MGNAVKADSVHEIIAELHKCKPSGYAFKELLEFGSVSHPVDVLSKLLRDVLPVVLHLLFVGRYYEREEAVAKKFKVNLCRELVERFVDFGPPFLLE